MNSKNLDTCKALLILRNLKVHNANAISSCLTYGFPPISAFTGFTTALERAVGKELGIEFYKIGVICHEYQIQITKPSNERLFHLKRNPLDNKGNNESIVEEGRMDLNLTLVIDIEIPSFHRGELERKELAKQIAFKVQSLRIAGGSILNHDLDFAKHKRPSEIFLIPDIQDEEEKLFHKIKCSLLPGFCLVSRHDLLIAKRTELRVTNPNASSLDAFLDIACLKSFANHNNNSEIITDSKDKTVIWKSEKPVGWIVPIPIGFNSLSEKYEPGAVKDARDPLTPFRFVEPIWSIGEWLSPLRLSKLDDLYWYNKTIDNGKKYQTYYCSNDYKNYV